MGGGLIHPDTSFVSELRTHSSSSRVHGRTHTHTHSGVHSNAHRLGEKEHKKGIFSAYS